MKQQNKKYIFTKAIYGKGIITHYTKNPYYVAKRRN